MRIPREILPKKSSDEFLEQITGVICNSNPRMKSSEEVLDEFQEELLLEIPWRTRRGIPGEEVPRYSREFLDKSPDEFLEQIDRGQQPLEEFLEEIYAEIPERNHRINS